MSASISGKVLLAIGLAMMVSGCGGEPADNNPLHNPADDVAKPMGNGELFILEPGQKDSWTYYKMFVPPGTYEMKLRTVTTGGDLDIYAQFGSLPTQTSYKYKSTSSSDQNPREDLLVGEVSSGDLYIGVYGATDYNFSLFTALANSELLPKIASFSLSSKTVKGGDSVKAIVELAAPAPHGGMGIAIDTSRPEILIPLTITPVVSAGSKRLEFDIPTPPVQEPVTLLVVAQFNYVGDRIPVALTITP